MLTWRAALRFARLQLPHCRWLGLAVSYSAVHETQYTSSHLHGIMSICAAW